MNSLTRYPIEMVSEPASSDGVRKILITEYLYSEQKKIIFVCINRIMQGLLLHNSNTVW